MHGGDLFKQRRKREAASACLYLAVTCFAAALAAIVPFLLAPWSLTP